MLVVLGLHHRNRVICVKIEDVVSPLRLFSNNHIALQIYFSVGDAGLHGDVVTPSSGLDGRGNIIQLDVFFAHLKFGQNGLHTASPSGYIVWKEGFLIV